MWNWNKSPWTKFIHISKKFSKLWMLFSWRRIHFELKLVQVGCLSETCSHKTRTKSPEILDGFWVFEGFLSPSPIPSVWCSWVSPSPIPSVWCSWVSPSPIPSGYHLVPSPVCGAVGYHPVPSPVCGAVGYHPVPSPVCGTVGYHLVPSPVCGKVLARI